MSTYRTGHYWLFEEGEAPRVVYVEDNEMCHCGSDIYTPLIDGIWIGVAGLPAFVGPVRLAGPIDSGATEFEAMRDDALRYRWLCDGNGYFMEENGLCHLANEKAQADEAIDKAMRGEW